MGLGISTSGGDFDPYLKYNAKAGRWYTKPEGGGEETEVREVTGLFDFANVKTGWFLFADGVAPERTFHRSLSEKSPRPSDKHKEGFQLRVLLSQASGGGVKEFSSTAGAVVEEIDGLHDFVVAAPEYATGKVPVVQCVGVTPIKNKHGTNYRPNFKIVGWKPRPPELDATEEEPDQPAHSIPGRLQTTSRASAYADDGFSGGYDPNSDVPF